METKHNYFKNYRTIINRGDEIKPKDLRANGTYAVAWKEEGITDTQWGIIVLEDHKIKYCYNLLAKDIWMGFPIDEKVTIDMHIFKANKLECDHAELFMDSIKQDEYIANVTKSFAVLKAYKADIEHSTWHKIAAALRKFFSV